MDDSRKLAWRGTVPYFLANSAFIEAKAVTGQINLSHSRWQTIGFLDALSRSPAGIRGPAGARPLLGYITTSNTTISAATIARANGLRMCLTQSIVCEWVPPKGGKDIQVQPAVILSAHCPKGIIIAPAFDGTLIPPAAFGAVGDPDPPIVM